MNFAEEIDLKIEELQKKQGAESLSAHLEEQFEQAKKEAEIEHNFHLASDHKLEEANKILDEPLHTIGEDGGLYSFLEVENLRSRLRVALLIPRKEESEKPKCH